MHAIFDGSGSNFTQKFKQRMLFDTPATASMNQTFLCILLKREVLSRARTKL